MYFEIEGQLDVASGIKFTEVNTLIGRLGVVGMVLGIASISMLF